MTKQLNKKGTSLVELIAVIVIMGIIAGIAIPTTIAVINRQKKNTAVKSVESLVSTIKNVLLEAQANADSTGAVTLTAEYGSGTTGTSEPNADPTLTGSSFAVTKSDLAVDNLKLIGEISISISADGKFTATAANLKSDGEDVNIKTDCTVAAGTTSNS